MGLLNLIARLSLNTSGFQQGLKRSEGMASKTATHISGEFRKKFLRAFGAGAAIAGVTSMIRSTGAYAQRLTDLSRRHDITTDEVQQIEKAARDASMTFEEFASTIEKGGETLTQFAARSALTAEAIKMQSHEIETMLIYMRELADLQRSVFGWVAKSASEISSYAKGIKNLIDTIKQKGFDNVSTMDFWKLISDGHASDTQRIWDEHSESQKSRLEKGKATATDTGRMHGPPIPPAEATRFHVDRPNVNSLQQMGAFAANNQTVTEQKKSNQILARIEKNTASREDTFG